MSIRKVVLFATTILVAGVAFLAIASNIQPVRSFLGKSTIVRYVHFKVQALFLPLITQSVIDEYVESHEIRKLQIGAGSHLLDEWLNTDISFRYGVAYLDATRPFPLDDSSFHYVFSEHVIEHLPYESGLTMLRESYRVLEQGGKIRIATPDLNLFASLFQEEKTEEMRRYLDEKIETWGWPEYPTPECFVMNYEIRSWGHVFLYDPKTLATSLEMAGFRDIRRVGTDESEDPNLRSIDLRTGFQGRFETMILEATKPTSEPL